MPDQNREESGWIRLSDSEEEKFFCGITLKFKTNDSGPTGFYQYALGVLLPFNEQLMFVSLEGQCWAHGPFPLPAESSAATGDYTVSVAWLKANLHYIANIEDKTDVWYAKSIEPIPERFDGEDL
jgi:hypothetical protein